MKALRGKAIAILASFASLLFLSGFSPESFAVPSFARQTGVACEGCHTVFPELTPFGRSFKLNGYLMDNLPQVKGMTTDNKEALLLNWLPPLSIMFQTSYTSTSKALPDPVSGNSQNGQVLFPQQASLFYAGRIAPNLGGFIQMTYSSASGTFGWDNTDIRYADHATVAGKDVTWGVSFNNNPTVQDVWNSTPAWQTPFDQKTSAAPVPGAITQIDGLLTGRGVAGLTGYLWLRNSIYAEYGIYRSSPQGFNVNGLSGPLDSTAGGTLTSNAPYWRLAYEHQWSRNSLSVGMYGMEAKISPEGQPVAPPHDRFRDTAFDGQYQYIGEDHILSAQTTLIKERQHLDGTFALGNSENATNDLKTFRLGGSYYYRRTYGAALGHFSTTGSSDAILYAARPVFGFGNNSPNSSGWIGNCRIGRPTKSSVPARPN